MNEPAHGSVRAHKGQRPVACARGSFEAPSLDEPRAQATGLQPLAHIAIIGAGPAGASCAALVARAAIRVTLLESRAFPRVKVCGEFVSPAATDLLESLVPPRELLAAGARRVHSIVIEEGEREREWPMPAPGWALSRATLDAVLLEKARESGATVRQPAAARDVAYEEDRAAISLASGETLAADLVIHADGHGRFDPAPPTPSRPGVIALKCHFRPRSAAPLPGVRMRACEGAYVGTIQVEGALATCALVARNDVLNNAPSAADNDARFDELLLRLWPAFDPAARCSPWLASGVPSSSYVAPGHPRSFRIGNAAAAIEPVGGEGIGLALWSGTALAAALINARDRAPDAHFAPAALHRVHARLAAAYRRRVRFRRPACRLTAELFMRPALVRALWPLGAAPGLCLRPWWALTGKPA